MTEKRIYRPTRQLSGKPIKFKKWEEYAIGDVLLCKYVKTTPNKFNESKPNHVVEVIETFFKDKKSAWTEGTHVCLNTMGKLDKALEDIKPGDVFQITYNGTAVITQGKFKGKEAHDVDVVLMESSDETEINEEDDL